MVRAKFTVQSGGKIVNTDGNGTVRLLPVTSGSKENEQYFCYTPAGVIELSILNPSALAQFEEGKEYYVDFTKVE